MKIITFQFLLIFASLNFYGQTRLHEIKDEKIINILSKIESSTTIKSKKYYITLFRINNGSISAGIAESDEASHSFYISLSEYDENPLAKLFLTGPFINPQIVKEEDFNERFVISIRHGLFSKEKMNKLIISQGQVKLE